MTNNNQNSQHKKSASTNNMYQSVFMPIFSHSEAKIKKWVVMALVLGLGLTWLRRNIADELALIKRHTPKDLQDREVYINGFIFGCNKLIKEYQKAQHSFVVNLKRNNLPKNTSVERVIDMRYEAKGAPNIEWYDKEIKKFLDNVDKTTITTNEKGKQHISLWQKAELDVRHNKQMEMLDEFADEDYAYISSHPDCSERCSTFQGCLVALHKHSIKNPPKKIRSYKDLKKSDFFVEKVDGIDCYSLPDIMAVEDKYGYNNNIISGFNCRHHLIKYTPNKLPPKEYSKDDIKKQREIEQHIRELERQIRYFKMELNEYNVIANCGDIEAIKKCRELKTKIKRLVSEYKTFCNENGYAWYDYRIKVSDNEIYK